MSGNTPNGHEESDQRVAVGIAVDYKVLFLGSCSLIVLLGGTAFRVWDTAAQREYEHADKLITRIEQRLTELEARFAEATADRRQLRAKADDQENRIREIDRALVTIGRIRDGR